MKKLIRLLLAVVMALALAACGGKETAGEWTRQGYYEDENGNILSVTWMELDTPEDAGWYVGAMLGEDMYGNMLAQEDNTLHGNLVPDYEEGTFIVTVSEEGADGVALKVEGGETYHFKPMDLPDATIFVYVNTEGWGNIDYAEGEVAPEIDEEYPFQSAQINLAEPTTYTFVAWPDEGSLFVKWTKDGEDFSTEPTITVELDESAEFVAVFEDIGDGQNPAMNFIGNYVSGRAHALVAAELDEFCRVTIEWADSATSGSRWEMVGIFDADDLTLDYDNCVMSYVTYQEDGSVDSETVEYENGTGRIIFSEGRTFTWQDDQSDRGDMVFEWEMPDGND